MKKKVAALVLGAAVLGAPVLGPFSVSVAQADPLADRYFSEDTLELTEQERRALDIVSKWQQGSGTEVRPFAGRGGAVQFVFGMQKPTVVCAVLQVCDIALQPGEQVNSIQLGDTARWNVEPAISGTSATQTLHLIIKPLDVGLETSLVVTTDRRTYHIRLRSHRTEYLPQVSFMYPNEVLAKWQTIQYRAQQVKESNTIPETREYLGNLSFEYDITGSTPWKPLRVYNDRVKTIVQMPETMQQTEAPTLLVVRADGGLFSEPETVMVNYRVQGDRYIVDTVFDKAILIAGVGSNQEKITITRRK